MQMDNVMLAPHNSNSSPAAWERVHWNTIRNLLEGLGLDAIKLRLPRPELPAENLPTKIEALFHKRD